MKDILFDPQTSGGLLIVAGKDITNALQDKLLQKGVQDSAVIGEIIDEPSGKIFIE